MTSAPSRALADTLARLGESVRFVAYGTLGAVLPGLEVEGAGDIGMPVSAAAAKRLIRQATAAPYGRGEETILDPGVRRTWQIAPERIRLLNPEWQPFIERIVAAVRSEFGISRKVEARLYKLLIYEKGSFFAAHRDSEKARGMFATLIVCLPSRHRGGQLSITHDGRTVTVDFGGDGAEYGIRYAAFYADCLHEVEPVTDGYRVCLVYNLVASRGGRRPRAPRTEDVVDEVASILSRMFEREPDPLDRIVIPLTHQYTEEGFHPAGLKGADRARADVLQRAAKQLDCNSFLALMTHWQVGEADYDTYHPRRGRRNRWNEYEEPDDPDVEIGWLSDESYTVAHWFDATGQRVLLGPMHIREQEILGRRPDAERPYTQEVHEATGNEGVSVERWYREAIVAIWPRVRHSELLAEEGQASAIPVLTRMTKAAQTAEALDECRELAERIIDHWRIDELGLGREPWSSRMLSLLHRLDSPDLSRRFIDEILARDFRRTDGRILTRICDHFGWPTFERELTGFFERRSPGTPGFKLTRVVSLFESLCCESPPGMTVHRRRTCTALAGAMESLILRCDARPRRRVPPPAWSRHRPRARAARAGVPDAVIRACVALGDVDRLHRFVTHLIENERLYPLRRVLIPAVLRLREPGRGRPGAAAVRRLRDHCIAELRSLTAQPVEPPSDWSRDVLVKCSCDDCNELNRFLLDPSQRVHRFKVRKERRRHLHQQVERYRCDVTHVTERRGSPQTLVCTKTQASYERMRKRRERDLAALRELGG